MALIRCLAKPRSLINTNVRTCRILTCYFSENTRPSPKEDEFIKYTTSRAARWKAKHTRQGTDHDDKPPYQPVVVVMSVAVFLVYFCIFREENDIDEELGKSLYERVEGLEEVHLKTSLKLNKERGVDTSVIEERLKQIQEEKNGQSGKVIGEKY